MTPYERVQLSRQRTAGVFPLPNVLDCIRYSICELAEMDDALLRQERTGDKRNSDKAHDPRSELGQALYMLLSAAVQLRCDCDVTPQDASDKFAAYVASMRCLVSCAYYADRQTTGALMWHVDDAFAVLCSLAHGHGWSVDALIDDTCARFEAKHAPQEAQ